MKTKRTINKIQNKGGKSKVEVVPLSVSPFFSKAEESTALRRPRHAWINQAPSSILPSLSILSGFFSSNFSRLFSSILSMEGERCERALGDNFGDRTCDSYGTFSILPPPEQIEQNVASVRADTVRTSILVCVNKSHNLSTNICPHTVTKGSPLVQGKDETIALIAARTDVITINDFFSFFFFSSSETNIPEL